MPDASYLSITGAKVEAEEGVARLADAVLHLFKAGFSPTPTTPLSDFLANECDFDGYEPQTIEEWAEPVLAGAGYAIFAPTQTFRWDFDADGVGNQVGGSFLVLTTGELYQYTVFDPTRPCQGPDQAIITQPTDVYLAG